MTDIKPNDNPKPSKIPKLNHPPSQNEPITNEKQSILSKDGNRLRCMFLLPQKQGRQCKMTRRKGDKFCALHKNVNPDATDPQARVPCPIDPKHTVLKKKLPAHIKKCNAAKQDPIPAWFDLDKNVAHNTSQNLLPADNVFTQTEYQVMNSKLQTLWNNLLANEAPQLEQLSHQGTFDRISELENPKHAIQQSSLIGHMQRAGLLDYADSQNCPLITIEFGCGRAELSRYVSRAHYFNYKESLKTNIPLTKPVHRPFLLIDRGGPRMKFDTKMLKDYEEELLESPTKHIQNPHKRPQLQRESTKHIEEMISASEFKKKVADGSLHPPPLVQRVKMDIKDLDLETCLNSLFQTNQKPHGVAAISKHLCGCATDLTLQCLANGLDMNHVNETNKNNGLDINHVSETNKNNGLDTNHVNETTKNNGLDINHVSETTKNNGLDINHVSETNDTPPRHRLKGLVIALCCRQLCNYQTYPLVGRKFLADNHVVSSPREFQLLTKMTSWAINGHRETSDTSLTPNNTQEPPAHVSGFSFEERERIGQIARHAIDYGRLLFLSSKGYNVKIVQYVDSSVSLENRALVCY